MYVLDLLYIEGIVPKELSEITLLINHVGEKVQVPMYLIEIDKEKFEYCLFMELDESREDASLLLEHCSSCFIQLSLEETLKIKQNMKRILLIMDNSSLLKNCAVLKLLSGKKYELTLIHLEDNSFVYVDEFANSLSIDIVVKSVSSLAVLLADQFIGTRLFIVGQWSFIQEINNIAKNVGFTVEEIEYFLHGTKDEKVYCVKCSFINENDFFEKILKCGFCQSELEVTERYSKKWDAYLGYITGGTRSSKVVDECPQKN